MKVEFAGPAKRDLINIGLYIAKDSPARALTFIQELEAACIGLAENPSRFEITNKLADTDIRRRIYGNYLIFYRIGKHTVQVVRVLNSAMNYELML